MRVLSKIVTMGTLDIQVSLRFEGTNSLSPQKVDEIRAALRELGLDDSVKVDG